MAPRQTRTAKGRVACVQSATVIRFPVILETVDHKPRARKHLSTVDEPLTLARQSFKLLVDNGKLQSIIVLSTCCANVLGLDRSTGSVGPPTWRFMGLSKYLGFMRTYLSIVTTFMYNFSS